MQQMNSHYPFVLVYGTLKSDQPNHRRFMMDADYFGDYDRVRGVMFSLGGFPAINLDEPLTKIQCELYQVSPKILEDLDHLEGHPKFYRRVETWIPEQEKNAWIYVFTKEKAAELKIIVPDGNWKGAGTKTVNWLGWGKGWEGMDEEKRVVEQAPKEVLEQLMKGGPQVARIPCPEKPGYFWVREVDRQTGEILVGSKIYGPYKYLGDNENGKPRFLVPSVHREVEAALTPANDDNKRIVPIYDRHGIRESRVPIPIVSITKKEEPKPFSFAGPGVEEA